jgi:hypothetical protein
MFIVDCYYLFLFGAIFSCYYYLLLFGVTCYCYSWNCCCCLRNYSMSWKVVDSVPEEIITFFN